MCNREKNNRHITNANNNLNGAVDDRLKQENATWGKIKIAS